MWFKKVPASAKSSVCSRCGAVEVAEKTAVTAARSQRAPKSSVSGKRPAMDGKNNSAVTAQQQQNVYKKSPQATNIAKKAIATSPQQQPANKTSLLQNNKVNKNNKINIHVVNNVAAAIGCVAVAAAAQQPKSNNNAVNAQATALLTLIGSQRFAMPRGGSAVASGSVNSPHLIPRHPSPVSPVCQQPMPILSR